MRVRVYFYRVVQGAHAVFVRMRTGWGLAVLKCGAQRLTRDTISSRLLVAHQCFVEECFAFLTINLKGFLYSQFRLKSQFTIMKYHSLYSEKEPHKLLPTSASPALRLLVSCACPLP